LGGRSVGTSGHGVNGIIVVGLSGVITLAAATLTADGLSGDVPVDYSLISTSTPPAPPPIPLAPNDRGYVRVETKSGSTRCSIAAELVACQTSADNGPRRPDGRRFHTASVSAQGDFHWVDADLGALEGRVTLQYLTYTAQGWTINATPDRTTFTNDRTGHGMSVGDQSVAPF
jgi:hypothetical protein